MFNTLPSQRMRPLQTRLRCKTCSIPSLPGESDHCKPGCGAKHVQYPPFPENETTADQVAVQNMFNTLPSQRMRPLQTWLRCKTCSIPSLPRERDHCKPGCGAQHVQYPPFPENETIADLVAVQNMFNTLPSQRMRPLQTWFRCTTCSIPSLPGE